MDSILSKNIFTRLAVTICLLSHGFSHCPNGRKYVWISHSSHVANATRFDV